MRSIAPNRLFRERVLGALLAAVIEVGFFLAVILSPSRSTKPLTSFAHETILLLRPLPVSAPTTIDARKSAASKRRSTIPTVVPELTPSITPSLAPPSGLLGFLDGQRGIVLMRTFNEAPDIEGPTIQHTITPGNEEALAAAFIWRRFEVPGVPLPLLACVLVTVPSNQLLATLPTDRMPAFLAASDWAKWLGEELASNGEVKACLKTVEGVRWTMTKEERAARRRRKSTPSNPTGML